jgi:hypothetical protein
MNVVYCIHSWTCRICTISDTEWEDKTKQKIIYSQAGLCSEFSPIFLSIHSYIDRNTYLKSEISSKIFSLLFKPSILYTSIIYKKNFYCLL